MLQPLSILTFASLPDAEVVEVAGDEQQEDDEPPMMTQIIRLLLRIGLRIEEGPSPVAATAIGNDQGLGEGRERVPAEERWGGGRS